MKKATSLLLSLLLTLSLVPTAFASNNASLTNFQQTATYTVGQFTDVKSGEWYETSVKAAYELGLVKGSSDTTFSPAGSITIAETLALASRLHSIYNTGKAEFEQGTIWYEVYVTYAIANGIITEGQFSSYTAKATRAEFAAIMAKALPTEELTSINTIENGAIPDVAMTDKYASEIYSLYKAGILTGNDDSGTFTPTASIQRCAVAAIVTRMADTSLRQYISLVNSKQLPDLETLWACESQNHLDSLDIIVNGKRYYCNILNNPWFVKKDSTGIYVASMWGPQAWLSPAITLSKIANGDYTVNSYENPFYEGEISIDKETELYNSYKIEEVKKYISISEVQYTYFNYIDDYEFVCIGESKNALMQNGVRTVGGYVNIGDIFEFLGIEATVSFYQETGPYHYAIRIENY